MKLVSMDLSFKLPSIPVCNFYSIDNHIIRFTNYNCFILEDNKNLNMIKTFAKHSLNIYIKFSVFRMYTQSLLPFWNTHVSSITSSCTTILIVKYWIVISVYSYYKTLFWITFDYLNNKTWFHIKLFSYL